MANSLKCMLFSLIGFIVFFIIGLFLPLITIVSSCFGLFAAVSLIVFVFKSLQTSHHFLKSSIGFAIFSFFCFTILTINNIFGSGIDTDDIFIGCVNQVLLYGFYLSAIYCVISLLLLLLDFFFGIVNLTKERDVLPIKLFRLGIYWSYIVGGLGAISIFSIPEINIIAQLFMIVMYVFNIIMISVIIQCCTLCKQQIKLILMNVIILFISVFMLIYFELTNVLTSYFIAGGLSIDLIFKYMCHLWSLLLILQFIANMVISIFKPKISVLSCFVPILYAALGLLCSGVIYYDEGLNPYRIESLNFIYYYIIIVFAVGIGISFMSATYKLIFEKKDNNTY